MTTMRVPSCRKLIQKTKIAKNSQIWKVTTLTTVAQAKSNYIEIVFLIFNLENFISRKSVPHTSPIAGSQH